MPPDPSLRTLASEPQIVFEPAGEPLDADQLDRAVADLLLSLDEQPEADATRDGKT
jgi:hypothetical protein